MFGNFCGSGSKRNLLPERKANMTNGPRTVEQLEEFEQSIANQNDKSDGPFDNWNESDDLYQRRRE